MTRMPSPAPTGPGAIKIENSELPAFPCPSDVHGQMHQGLTKREYFAGLAMQGLLSDVHVQLWMKQDPRFKGDNFAQVAAVNAYEFADALIAAGR